MSASGRQQTLLSIYGSTTSKRTREKPPAQARHASKPLVRKTTLSRPKTAFDSQRNNPPSLAALLPAVIPPQQIVQPPAQEQQTLVDSVSLAKDRVVRHAKASPPPSTANAAATTPSPRSHVRHRDERKAVLSFYGDGFLEIPPQANAIACDEFAISILLFKAANENKPKRRSSSEAVRHQHPELDDDGDFFRWTCCGSTDRNVYGCLAAQKQQQAYQGHAFEDTKSPPTIIAAKFPSCDSDGSIRFVLFDRGVRNTKNDLEDQCSSGCKIWWRGYECWANRYEIPSNRWVQVAVTFDGCFLRIYFDRKLVDCASISKPKSTNVSTSRERGSISQWVSNFSNNDSLYIGGHTSYAKSVREWRTRIGFIGLIARVSMWKTADVFLSGLLEMDWPSLSRTYSAEINAKKIAKSVQVQLLQLIIPDVGQVKDMSVFKHTINVHRTIFWRTLFPPLTDTSSIASSIVLLDNFFHGAHHDVAIVHAKSFENWLLTVLHKGDVHVIVDYALNFDLRFIQEHGCSSKNDYSNKAAAVIRGIEAMSPLLNVVVNEREVGSMPAIGSFEISIQVTRVFGSQPVSIELHSMASSSCYPSVDDIQTKVSAIILQEAKRSPGEKIHEQAFREFLALAGQNRQNRERIFLESVINRKIVLTEKKIVSVFSKIGFFFSVSELQDVVQFFKNIQEGYLRKQHRMEDLPSMSMIPPTSSGLYALPMLSKISISSVLASDVVIPKSPWRFICLLLDYDFQLLEFVHEQCPNAQDGNIIYRQNRYLYGGFVDRVELALPELSNRVYCVLFCLQRANHKEDAADSNPIPDMNSCTPRITCANIQIENSEAHQMLGMFDATPTSDCRWFTLAALYRSKKIHLWKFQALGGCGQANSIHAGLEEINGLLVQHQILQTYEIVISYAVITDSHGGISEYEEYARHFSRNIRFGKNGHVVMKPIVNDGSFDRHNNNGIRVNQFPFRVALKLQSFPGELEVYKHEYLERTLPTVQSVYRSILRILADNGIKESLQQNPFVATEKRSKRLVEIRVVSEQTNQPVEQAYVFIERNMDNVQLSTSLAKKIVPTLTMGSRLVSIRRRLQRKRVSDEIAEVANAFVQEVIHVGTKLATFALRRHCKLLPHVRSRTMMKQVMKKRYHEIRGHILQKAEENERARIYSRNGPIRLQQLYKNSLQLSNSEQDLLEDIMIRGAEAVQTEEDARPSTTKGHNLDTGQLYDAWHSQRQPNSEEINGDPSTRDSEANEESGSGLSTSKFDPLSKRNAASGIALWERTKESKKYYATDKNGRIVCHLTPGSYSVYVFNFEYFEWTSLVVIFPSGFFGDAVASSSSAVQNILIPLEVFRWSYNIQLVDFYQQHLIQPVAAIPFQITDKCSFERTVVSTNSNGCATWDVKKGIYLITALKDCGCILYSASKNVVVEGGRYRPSRTIQIPVLIGKVVVDLIIASVDPGSTDSSTVARVVCIQESKIRHWGHDLDSAQNAQITKQATLGNACSFQLRLGKHALYIDAPGFVSTHANVNVVWTADQVNPRYLAVLCPTFQGQNTYRVIFSYMNMIGCMNAILEVQQSKGTLARVWEQAREFDDHVSHDGTHNVENCEFQSFTVNCHAGFSYNCVVALKLQSTGIVRFLNPRIQVYSSTGLVFDQTQTDEDTWKSEFYWKVCTWDESGQLCIPHQLALDESDKQESDQASVASENSRR